MSFRVCIDPGHGRDNSVAGRFDPGAVACGVQEASIMLEYALTLAEACRARGLNVFLTRSSPAQPAPLRERARWAEKAGCRFLLSLHANAAANPAARGVEALYGSPPSRQLAALLSSSAAEAIGLRNRGAKKRRDLAVLRFSAGPAVLMELGFLTNAGDRAALLDPDRRSRACRALAETVINAISHCY